MYKQYDMVFFKDESFHVTSVTENKHGYQIEHISHSNIIYVHIHSTNAYFKRSFKVKDTYKLPACDGVSSIQSPPNQKQNVNTEHSAVPLRFANYYHVSNF